MATLVKICLTFSFLGLTLCSCDTEKNEPALSSESNSKNKILVELRNGGYHIDNNLIAPYSSYLGIYGRKLIFSDLPYDNHGGSKKNVIDKLEDTILLPKPVNTPLVVSLDASGTQKISLPNKLTPDFEVIRLSSAGDPDYSRRDGRFSKILGIRNEIIFVYRQVVEDKKVTKAWLHGLDFKTGAVIWTSGIITQDLVNVTFSDERIYLGSVEKSISLDQRTGKGLVEYSMGLLQYPGGDNIYFLTPQGKVVARNEKTGAVQWESSAEMQNGQINVWRLVVAGEHLLAKTGPSLYAFDIKTGKVKWTQSNVNNFVNQPVQVLNNMVYTASTTNRIIAYDLTGGTKQWESRPIHSVPNFSIENGKILVQSNSEMVNEMNPITGEIIENGLSTWYGAVGPIDSFHLLSGASLDL